MRRTDATGRIKRTDGTLSVSLSLYLFKLDSVMALTFLFRLLLLVAATNAFMTSELRPTEGNCLNVVNKTLKTFLNRTTRRGRWDMKSVTIFLLLSF